MSAANPTPTVRLLRGVVFDMDGVLVDSEPIMMHATARMFAELGYAIPEVDLRPFVGMGEDKIIEGAASEHGISLNMPDAKARTYAIYFEMIPGRLKPIAGAVEFVAHCRGLGLRLAVASSADAIKVDANLRELGLSRSSFDAVVTGGDVVRRKPAPDIFIEAIRRLGLDAGNCLIIEDAIAGVAAAKAAKARCLGITSTFAANQLALADWIAPNLAEVPVEALGW